MDSSMNLAGKCLSRIKVAVMLFNCPKLAVSMQLTLPIHRKRNKYGKQLYPEYH